MPAGSTYAALKTAIVTKLQARPGLTDTAVSAAPPADPLNLTGPGGTGKAIWIADAEGSYENEIIGGPPLRLEEIYTLTVVFQALPANTSDTQLVTDARVDDMLGEFLAQMASDITWGVTAFEYLHTTYGDFRRFVGPISDRNFFPSRCELDLGVEARIVLP